MQLKQKHDVEKSLPHVLCLHCDRDLADNVNSTITAFAQKEIMLYSYQPIGSSITQSDEKAPNEIKDVKHQPHMIGQESNNNRLSSKNCDWLNWITWQKLGVILVQKLGSKTALKLLNSINIPDNCLSKEFFRSCVKKELLSKQQR